MALSYEEGRQEMIKGLLRAAAAHEAGRLALIEIPESYDLLDFGLPRDGGPEFDKLLVALEFWGGWIDSRNHDWQYYDGIGAADWPRLARSIAADLDVDREITSQLRLRTICRMCITRFERAIKSWCRSRAVGFRSLTAIPKSSWTSRKRQHPIFKRLPRGSTARAV